MARTTEADVRSITGEASAGDAALSIETATLLVTEELGDSDLSAERLEQIELYLAAHFLVLSVREGPLAAETLDDSTERYHNIYAAGLRATRFGQQVLFLDTTGTFARMADSAENPGRKDAQFRVV